jgi:hypothetical protein
MVKWKLRNLANLGSWGWHYPLSLKEADLEQNLLAALESVPVESMRK